VQKDEWPRIAVMGAGAVGCYFGGMLARAGAPVMLIGRPRHVEALTRKGLFPESLHFQRQIPVSASTGVGCGGRIALRENTRYGRGGECSRTAPCDRNQRHQSSELRRQCRADPLNNPKHCKKHSPKIPLTLLSPRRGEG
jgi:hypothetical protein